jgi:hypothetical protein
MATNPTAQWWVRNDGNDGNGGGYDSGIGGAATNYSDQAAAQASWATLTLAAGTLTDAGATGLFTALMIGNAVNVPGQGYYWITAFTNSNTVTVTAGTGATTSFTTQPGKLGGAFRNPSNLSNGGSVSAPATTTALVSGNKVNVRASGSGSVGSPDYTQTGYAEFPNGDTTNGYISWVAYNGTPYLKGDGLVFHILTYHKMVGLYITTSGSSNGAFGIINYVTICTFISCTIDANNQACTGIFTQSGGGQGALTVIGCNLVGGGTTSLNGAQVQGYGEEFKNCAIHGWGSWGILENADPTGVNVVNCAVYGNTAGGISLTTTSVELGTIDGCTIDANGGDGVQINSTAAAVWTRILNNNITNNGGYGINVAAGTTTTNNAAIAFADYNNVFNNTTANYHNISAGTHDLSVNPNYTNASTGHFTPANVALIAAAPIGFA